MEVDGFPMDPRKTTGHVASEEAFSNPELQIPDKRTKGLMEKDTSPTAPKERASILQYQQYVEETVQNLHQTGDIHTQIVDSFGISIKGKDFATLQPDVMLCDLDVPMVDNSSRGEHSH
jgi:hypothetical protein